MGNEYSVVRWAEPDLPDPNSLRESMVSEGYDVFHWCDRPGTTYGVHSHAEDQSHWIISGKLELTLEDIGTFILEPGDRDFMPADTRHSARVIGSEEAHYLIGAKR